MIDHKNQKTDQYEILIVEDNPDSLNLLNRILKECGYRVRPTSNGSHALKSVAAKLPDLILLNIEMPWMNGYEVCRRLKSDKRSQNIPVIFISGYDGTTEKVKAFKAGGVDYITKPFEREEVLARVHTHLRLRELTERLEQLVDQRTQQLQQEIAERKKVQAALRESELQYRTLFERAGDAIMILDDNGRFVAVNKTACERLGYSRQELLQMTPQDIDTPEYAALVPERIAQLHRQGFNICESAHVSRDGTIIPIELHNRLIEYAGKPAVLCMVRDITARKQAEEELKKHRDHLEELVKERTAQLYVAKERAEAANQAKSLFLANMSHELRTPLNIIMGYSQLMQKESLAPAEQRDYLNTINRNSEHLLAMINDVLEISKIEARQIILESTTFDLPALFGDLEKAFDSSMEDKGLFFKIMEIDPIPRYVTTDKNKLRQVLVNILGNAVKFTDQGGITVRMATKDETDGTMRLAVEVQDTGMGIAEGEQDKVFAYLEQTAGGRAKKSGTGLGLAISRDYVRMMGGDITVTSEEGKGCTFRFEIDIQKGQPKDIKVRGPRQHVKGLQPGQKVPRILVVEDVEDSRILLVKILKTAGFKVEEAVNGKEAVEIFDQCRPDFIWMDIRMPVMDGLEATGRIKKTEAGQSTIVAALTAHALAEERDKILAAGCDDFVAKPFREQEIFEVMAKHLGLKYAYEEEPDAAVETEAQVTPQQLAALPADMRNRLHQAALELDEGRILKIIEQIKAHDTDLAGALKTIVNQLEFRRLLDLLTAGKPNLEVVHDGSKDS